MKDTQKEFWWQVPERDTLLNTMLNVPRKIMHHQDVDGLAQLVLHELGHDFWLKRATYLVDNPDFNCLKGVAGYYHDECQLHKKDVWSDPNSFDKDMESAEFHRLIKDFSSDRTLKQKNGFHDKDGLIELGKSFGMEKPEVHVWNLRNGNHGILFFECLPDCKLQNRSNDLVEGVSSLLGLCPA